MVLLVLGLAATTSADTIYVCWDGSGDYLTIQAGIDAASDGDEVVVCDGVYTGAGNKNLDFQGKAIIVRSENSAENCVIDCESDGRGFRFDSGETTDAVVDGFAISNGYWDGPGGGILITSNSNPTVVNCTFSGNSTRGAGGGIATIDSDPTVINCTFIGNSAYYGGGMYNHGGAPIVVNCTFSENSGAWRGGAMYNYSSRPTVSNCVFSSNSAERGGGMHNYYYSSPTITNCVFSGNAAGYYGGGMYNDRCFSSPTVTTVTNCLFTGNSARFDGGGIYNDDSYPRLTNCTFSGNSGDCGDGIYSRHGCHAIVWNCILWGDDTGYEIWGSAFVHYSDVQGGGWPGEGNIDADPLFVDPDDGDYRLSAGSPCIDAAYNCALPLDKADLDSDGDTNELTSLDLDGGHRFVDDPHTADTGVGLVPIVDMGAYEFPDGFGRCPGDLNGDHVVDQSDLGILLSAWLSSDEGDLNCDGVTDHADLGILLADWGCGTGP